MTSPTTGVTIRFASLPSLRKVCAVALTCFRRVTRMLRLEEAGARDVRPVALWGMPGVGKTTVANAFALTDGLEAYFPDGIVWIPLGPHPAIRKSLNDLGKDFGADLISEPDESACVQRLRSILHRRRTLLIVDDVWEPEHGMQFVLTGPWGRTVLTTRESLVAFPLATRRRSIRVRELHPSQALAMLGEVAPEAVRHDRTAAMGLCRRLGFLPLALKLAGGLLAQEGEVPGRLDALLDELTNRRKARLALTQTEARPGLDPDAPASLEAILALSVDRLNEADRQRFALLSTFGGEPLFWVIEHATVMWDCGVQEAEATTSRLIQRGLIERRGKEYWMHALLSDYAAELRVAKGL